MKFEVGDIVKVINDDNPFCDKVKVGDLGTVINEIDGVIDILFGDIEQTLFIRSGRDCLELVDRPIEYPKITPLSISEDFKTFMKDIKNKKEKKTMDIDIERIIFNKPATILYADGERYVTKAHQEEFDAEKGLALALLKAFGISYLDLQRLIKSATVQEKKAPKKKVETKVDKSTPKTEKPKKKCVGRVEQTVEIEKDGSKYTIHKGKRRGVGQKLQFGDSVLVRLCKVYDYEEIETVRELIGRPLKVTYVGESTVMLTLDGQKSYEFARNEVDRIDL